MARSSKFCLTLIGISILFLCVSSFASMSWAASMAAPLSEGDQDFKMALQIWGDGRSPEAQALLERALEIRGEILGYDSSPVAEVLERLGALSYNRHEYSKAEQLFRKAYEIDRKALGSDSLTTIYLMGDVGAALREQGRCSEAEEIVEQSITTYQKLLPANDPRIAARLNNLGKIYLCERRYADAQRVAGMSLAVYMANGSAAGSQSDQALLNAIGNAEKSSHRLITLGFETGAGALLCFFALIACNLWSEQRHITTAAERPLAVRIAGITAFFGLLLSVGILSSFAIDLAFVKLLPSEVSNRYEMHNVGKIGYALGIWLSIIGLQIFSNIGRRIIGLPMQPVVYFHPSAFQPRLGMQSPPLPSGDTLIQNSEISPPWFAAMEYYALILNRTYKVFVTDTMLCGANVRRWVSSPIMPSPQMASQAYWAQTPSAQLYEKLDVTSERFLKMNGANFQINWHEIAGIDYLAGRKWGMGNVPHSGRLVIRLISGESRELILLGHQDGDALCAKLNQHLMG